MSGSPRIACLIVSVASSDTDTSGCPQERGPLENRDELQDRLLELAAGFSPIVEDGREVARDPSSGLGLVRLDVQGLGRLHSSPSALLQELVGASERAALPGAVAAIADTPFSAAVLARALSFRRSREAKATTRTWISPLGGDQRSLAPLPLQLLHAPETQGLSTDSMEQLGLLAVRTIGAFTALPASSVERRFGQVGLRLQRLARGEGRRPLRRWRSTPSLHRKTEPDTPLCSLGSLTETLKTLLEELSDDLIRAGRGLTRIEARYTIERVETIQREVEILDHMADPSDWLRLIRLDLEARPMPGPVSEICVRVVGSISRSALSKELFRGKNSSSSPLNDARPNHESSSRLAREAPHGTSDELVHATIRIQERLGRDAVGVPVIVDRHRPESVFHLEQALPLMEGSEARPRIEASGKEPSKRRSPPLALRLVSPHRVSVEVDVEGRPRAFEGRPAFSAGPFPASGEWWSSPYDRTYFEVATGEEILWVFHDASDGQWYVQGVFD